MVAARSVLYLTHIEADGDVLGSKTITVTKADGSALGVSLYEQVSGGSPVVSPQTDSLGTKLLYANTTDLDAAGFGRVKVSYSDNPGTTFDDAFFPDPKDLFIDGRTRDMTLAAALSVTGLVTAGDLTVTDDVIGDLNVVGAAYAEQLGVYAGGDAFPVPADNMLLVAKTITANPPTGQLISAEANVSNGSAGDVSAIRGVIRDNANNQIHAGEFHLISATVAASSGGSQSRSGLTITTSIETAGATGIENSALRILSGAFPEVATPAATDNAILINYGGGSEYTRFIRAYGTDLTVRFQVETSGKVTAGEIIPRTTNTYQLGTTGARYLAVVAQFVNTSGNHGASAFSGPAIVDNQDTTTGIGFPASAEIGWAISGVEAARLTATTFSLAKKLTLASAELLTGVISPAQLTANTDDWNPTGIGTARVIRVSTDASRNLTGIAAQTAGTVLTICNVGAQNLVLIDSATSSATNQFALSANITLAGDQSCTVFYDGTSSRWRVLDR